MKDRLLTAERCPDGMRGSCFYQKDFARGLPAGVPTEPVRAETTGRVVRYVVGGSRRTLLALVNVGCIPIHLMNCRRGALDRPDWLAFDLDPGSGRFADAAKAGLLLRPSSTTSGCDRIRRHRVAAVSTSWSRCDRDPARARFAASPCTSAVSWPRARHGW
jgi:bifunctional non-homologous end joining protein LigD